MLNAALVIIQDEHRSLAAVVQGLKHLVREMRQGGAKPDFRLLRAIVFYLQEFPEKTHHPKESAYLFARLRSRTREADTMIAELERQHVAGSRSILDLEQALRRYELAIPDGLVQFSNAVDAFAELALRHMALEESTVIPMAGKYLTAGDWVEIGAAFSPNGDPRFDVEADQGYSALYLRIVNLAPPTNGLEPAGE